LLVELFFIFLFFGCKQANQTQTSEALGTDQKKFKSCPKGGFMGIFGAEQGRCVWCESDEILKGAPQTQWVAEKDWVAYVEDLKRDELEGRPVCPSRLYSWTGVVTVEGSEKLAVDPSTYDDFFARCRAGNQSTNSYKMCTRQLSGECKITRVTLGEWNPFSKSGGPGYKYLLSGECKTTSSSDRGPTQDGF